MKRIALTAIIAITATVAQAATFWDFTYSGQVVAQVFKVYKLKNLGCSTALVNDMTSHYACGLAEKYEAKPLLVGLGLQLDKAFKADDKFYRLNCTDKTFYCAAWRSTDPTSDEIFQVLTIKQGGQTMVYFKSFAASQQSENVWPRN